MWSNLPKDLCLFSSKRRIAWPLGWVGDIFTHEKTPWLVTVVGLFCDAGLWLPLEITEAQ
jgi:hypothetical protein